MSLLKVNNLNKSFRAVHVLKDISLEINEGERLVLIGPNGAGKTTLFNCIYGTIPINSGSVYFNGKQINNESTHTRAHHGISRTFQKNNLFDELTLEENVQLAVIGSSPHRFRMFKPLDSHKEIMERAKELLDEWNLWDKKDFQVKHLSYGEQRLLELILALSSKPKLLMLDEPTSGMSPAETAKTLELIKSIPRSVTLIVIEHDMEIVFTIADRITVLHHGEIITTGAPEEIRGDEVIQQIYFGGGALSHA